MNLLNTNEIIAVHSSRRKRRRFPCRPLSAKIFIAQSQQLPLDPVVVSNSPAHDATNVPVNASIVLQFSKPMDTNSVQSAFSTDARRQRHVRVVAGARYHDVHVPAARGCPR